MKLNMDNVQIFIDSGDWPIESVGALQLAIYVMCGGGLLGKSAITGPADFYIDDRVGKLPYGRREIKQAVNVLVLFAVKHNLDPHKMPDLRPRFHSCGIF